MAQWRKVVVSGSTAELNNVSVSGDIKPITTDGSSLGSAALNFSDLFLDSGAVVNFDSGDMTLTHAANEVQVNGGDLVVESTNKVGFGGAPGSDYIQKDTDVKVVAAADIILDPAGGQVSPASNDDAGLGEAGKAWSDLFLAEGGVINWDSGDITLTQTADQLALAGGYLTVAGSITGSHFSGSAASTGSFGYLNVYGDAVIAGNLTFGDADTDTVSFGADIGSNLLPNDDDTYDLGSATQAWQDLFLEGDITLTDAGTIQTSAGALTLTSAAAATWSTAAGALIIDGAGGLTLDSDGTDAVNLGTEAVAKTITIGNAASTKVDINALALDFDSAAATDILAATTLSAKGAGGASFGDDTGTWEFDGSGALSETGITTVSITPSSTFDIDAGGAVTIDGSAITIGGDSDVAIDMDASTFDVDASGAVTVDSSAGAITIGGNAVGQKISVGGDTANRTEVELNAILVDINAGTNGVTIDGAGASTLTTSAGDITIDSVAGSVNVDGGESATNAVRIVASHTDGGIDVDAGTNGINVDSTGAISIGATNATSVTLGRAGQTITMPGNVDVNGTVFTIDATNIMISESFATFCSGSNIERDGGFMVESSSLSSGKGFGWDASIGRWGVDHDLAYDANSIGAESAQGAYLALVLDGTTYSHTTGSEYTKPGNIWIDGDDDIWIYT